MGSQQLNQSPHRNLNIISLFFLFSLFLLSVPALAQTSALESLELDLAEVENLRAMSLTPSEVLADFEGPSKSIEEILNRVFVRKFRIRYAPGRKIAVTEFFTLRSILRHPARSVVFLTGPEFRGNFWSIPVEGYNGPAMAAKRGFWAYTLDYVGVGESHLPADGSEINFTSQARPVRRLINLIRLARGVHRVDLVSEGYGVEVASQLADEPQRVRSVVMSTVVYRNFHPAATGLFTEEFEAFLRSQPNGYWEPNSYEFTLSSSPNEELRQYVLETQPGQYPTGPYLQIWDFGLPTIDAAAAEVPGLVLVGEFDPFAAPGDSAELAADWGGGGSLVVIPNSSYVPRIGAEDIAAQFFEELFAFLDE